MWRWPELLLDASVRAWRRATNEADHARAGLEFGRAKHLFKAALERDPDGNPQGLRQALMRELKVPILDVIRSAVLADLDKKL